MDACELFVQHLDFCPLVALLMSKASFLIPVFGLVRLVRTGVSLRGAAQLLPSCGSLTRVPDSRWPAWCVRARLRLSATSVHAPGTCSSRPSVTSHAHRGVALDSPVLRTEAVRASPAFTWGSVTGAGPPDAFQGSRGRSRLRRVPWPPGRVAACPRRRGEVVTQTAPLSQQGSGGRQAVPVCSAARTPV